MSVRAMSSNTVSEATTHRGALCAGHMASVTTGLSRSLNRRPNLMCLSTSRAQGASADSLPNCGTFALTSLSWLVHAHHDLRLGHANRTATRWSVINSLPRTRRPSLSWRWAAATCASGSRWPAYCRPRARTVQHIIEHMLVVAGSKRCGVGVKFSGRTHCKHRQLLLGLQKREVAATPRQGWVECAAQ